MVLFENLTDSQHPLSTVRVALDPSNSSSLLKSLEGSIQRLVPSATIDASQFRFEASTRMESPARNMWAIRENLTAVVTGVGSALPGVRSYNMNFLSMNMSDPVFLSGVEFNNVGNAIILQPLRDQPESLTTYYVNGGGPYSNAVIPIVSTVHFSMFDFSRVPKVSEWDNTYRPFDQFSTWKFDTPSKLLGGGMYNLTLGLRSPEQTLFKSFTAYYKPSLVLTAPPRARGEESTVMVDVATSSDIAMPVIIVGAVVAGVGSYIAERRFSKPFPSKKKSRGRG